MDDRQAIQQMKCRDINGLEPLVLRYQARAIRVAFLITHDEHAAKDVVQDVFLRIYHRIDQFDEDRPFEPYLIRSVVNAALNVAQKASKQISYDGEIKEVENLLSRAGLAESEVEYIQLKEAIVAALARLDPRQRAVIIQRYYLEMSEKEMAVALDTPPGTVKWLLNTARARLRNLLGSEGSSE